MFPLSGSSPRVRGKQALKFIQEANQRIIPARAGQTGLLGAAGLGGADHPRACGANASSAAACKSLAGSSPRVRGKPRIGGATRMVLRIIPARAGQTPERNPRERSGPDHPRACGANKSHTVSPHWRTGSSPRVRGKPSAYTTLEFAVRIIPARAGQTRSIRSTEHATSDHPRACGANGVMARAESAPIGSSPRVRGKRNGKHAAEPAPRIIPARAGQTCPSWLSMRPAPDHPRACGANPAQWTRTPTAYGSSPRVRGKLAHMDTPISAERIIPARAGQTRRSAELRVRTSDHPRACGANSWTFGSRSSMYGSSPRVRGKQSDFMRKLLSAGPSIIGFAQWLQSSCYCSCFQSSAKTPISRGTTPTSLFLGFQNSITLLLLT